MGEYDQIWFKMSSDYQQFQMPNAALLYAAEMWIHDKHCFKTLPILHCESESLPIEAAT